MADAPQIALVTGASRRIGAAIAERLAADGFAVAVHTHPDNAMVDAASTVVQKIRARDGSAEKFVADLTDADGIDRLIDECIEELGTPDVLVLNAAASAREPWDEIAIGDWERLLAVNLTSALKLCQNVFGDSSREGGSIVTLSSVQALGAGPQGVLHYATTKAGILGFTYALARELGSRHIRVNAVMPGAIWSEEELGTIEQSDSWRRIREHQALPTPGVATDIASAVSYLVGPESRFVTGQTLRVDGGWLMG